MRTILLVLIIILMPSLAFAQLVPVDPGVRGGQAGAGMPLPGLTAVQNNFFKYGLAVFTKVDSVSGTINGTDAGLGPMFNMDSCSGCHAQPAVGGTSPAVNPQVAVANKQDIPVETCFRPYKNLIGSIPLSEPDEVKNIQRILL